MATYIPGIQSYRPDYKPYTPNFEFANKVMSTREDRYNTNYKAMSDLYGSVVYADLSREDTKQQRDDFANRLAPKIQQISGLDLSLHQNIDAAQGVFKPFIENKLIQQDVYRTSRYKSELQRAQSLLDSPNKEIVDQYSETHIKALQYQMQDFINADPNEAMTMPIPEYVPSVNLYDMALKYLKDSGLEASDFTFTKDNRFIIKQKNGALIQNAAYEMVVKGLSGDPRVQKAYATNSYVKARDYAEEGYKAGKFSTVNEGRVAWANETISDIFSKAQAVELIQQGKVKESSAVLKRHQEYVSIMGEENLTPAEKDTWQQVLLEQQTEEAKLKNTNDLMSSARAPLSGNNQALLNKAYGLLMNWNMGDDLKAAARQYSMQDASRDIEINGYQRDIDKNNFDLQRQFIQNEFTASENQKNRNATIKAANITAGVNSNIKNALAQGDKTKVAFEKDEQGDPNTRIDAIALKDEAFKNVNLEMKSKQIELLLSYHQKKEGSSGTPNEIEIQTADGNKKLSISDARVELNKPENIKYVAEAYTKLSKLLSKEADVKKDAPNLDVNELNRFKHSTREIDGLVSRISLAEEEFKKRAKSNFDQALKFTNLDGVPKVLEDLENNVPKIVKEDGSLMSESEFVNLVVENARISKTQDLGTFWDGKFEKNQSTGWGEFTETEVVFDAEAAAEYAKEAYENQKTVLNGTFTRFYNNMGSEESDTPSFKAYGANYLLAGNPVNQMNDATAYMGNSYSTGVIVPKNINNLNDEAERILVSFINQTKQGGVSYIPGDAATKEKSDIEEDESATAKKLVEQALLSLDAGMGSSNDALFKLEYIDTYGAKDSDSKAGGYILTFDTKFLKKYTMTANGEAGSNLISNRELTKYSTISVLVDDKNQDLNPYSSNNFNYSQVDTDIQFNSQYSVNVTSGGSFFIYKDQGMYMLGGKESVFDPKSPTYKKEKNRTLQPIYYPNDESYGNLAGKLVGPEDIQRVADYIESKYVISSKELEEQIKNYKAVVAAKKK